MKCRFERAVFQSASGYCVFSYNTLDESVPTAARTNRYYSDRKRNSFYFNAAKISHQIYNTDYSHRNSCHD